WLEAERLHQPPCVLTAQQCRSYKLAEILRVRSLGRKTDARQQGQANQLARGPKCPYPCRDHRDTVRPLSRPPMHIIFLSIRLLLRAHRERPRSRCTANERDELAPF